jgi:small GTP-binding protein
MNTVLQKKICLLGGHAVGKTSLVACFVKTIFSEKYHTSIGVKIDKKVVTVGTNEVSLMIWDLAGEDEFGPLEISYLRGASGYLLVVDGTRGSTLQRALAVQRRAAEKLGPVPFVVLINKADLASEWEVTEAELAELKARGWPVYHTSAKTGEAVEAAFQALTEAMLAQA